MGVLNKPLFELNQESEVYKKLKLRKDKQSRINEIIDELANEFGFAAKDFSYYSSTSFGLEGNTESYEKFKESLTKNADHNGVYKFKKNSKFYKNISEKTKEIDDITRIVSTFVHHDVFGLNNAKSSQWIGDRYFVEVRNEEMVKKSETIKDVNYKEYLGLIMEYVGE